MELSSLPKDRLYRAHQEAVRQLFRESLYKTAKHLCGYKEVNWETHGEMIQALEAETLRKLIVMPRGTFKSSIGCVAYPILLLINNPNLRILLDSEIYTNSKNFLREIKGIMESDKFREFFGDWKSDTNWSEGEITIAARSKVFKEASITCGGIGTTKTGQHYDVIIGDDLNSENNSATTEGCLKVVQHYRMNVAILEPNGIYVVIGTRYNSGDLIGHIMENEIKPKGLIDAS